MPPRRRLLLQLGYSSATILGFLAAMDVMGPFPVAAVVEATAAAICVLAAQMARRDRTELGIHLLLATLLVTITIFDDGIQGQAHSWAMHIPLSLAALSLLDGKRAPLAWGWILMSWLSMAFVNATPWAPHWTTRTIADPSPAVSFFHFFLALGGSWLCIEFLRHGQSKLLAEAHDLSAELAKALDSAQAATRAKSQFVSHMSHELRTPLNAISGFTQILLDPRLPSEDVRENLQAIQTSADHLLHLVGEVLDLSRMEHGHLTLSSVPFHPYHQAERVLAILQHEARERGLSFTLAATREIPWVVGDPVRWKQIVLNLASNALKYTMQGSVEIRLVWEEASPQEGRLRTLVSDTGTGIPSDQIQRLFDRFERLPEHESSSVPGAGLGLSIARDLVDAMEGTMDVVSTPGEGSTFSFVVSLPISDRPSASSSDSWATPWNPQGVRVLLCEDNRLNIRLASQVLDRLGVEHAVAHDGVEALEILDRAEFNILLLDLHMPRKNGFEVAEALRSPASPPHLRKLPILALTADVSEETLDRVRRSGMDDYLSKPFHLAELESRLKKLVRRHQPSLASS